jgi:hypothetical protein
MELGKSVRFSGRTKLHMGHGETLLAAEDYTVCKGNEMTIIKVTQDELTSQSINQSTNQPTQWNSVLLGKLRVSFQVLKSGN